MSDYFLDTNIIINFLRGDQLTVLFLKGTLGSGSLIHCCEMTIAETYSGMRENERSATEAFLNSLVYLPIHREAAQQAGEWRRFYRGQGRNITLADALIAATALDYNLILLTENLKDYPMPELKKERPS